MANVALARILGGLSETQALHVYNALAQWADNERNGLDEGDSPVTESESATRQNHEVHVAAVEALVAELEGELVKLAP